MAEQGAWEVTLSLAGRTSEPKGQPVPTRVGGFGGAGGLARWLRENRIAAVVDATHPFAARISRNAAEACRAVAVPLVALRRPPWRAIAGDRWIEVATVQEAVRALGAQPRCVFVTTGRLELHHFAAAPQHRYVVRTIEPIADALPGSDVVAIRERGPFDAKHERELMRRERVEVVVTKNSGGAPTYAKIAAARELGLPVVMVARPEKPEADSVAGPQEALAWLGSQLASHGPAP